MRGRAAAVAFAVSGATRAAADPPPPPPPPAWLLQVTADRLFADPDAITAEGAVQVELVGQRCEATHLRYDRGAERLVLTQGRCIDAEGTAAFSRADLDVQGGTGVLFDARLEPEPGPLLVTADRVERLGPDRMAAQGAWLSLCTCPRGPWSVEARQVEVVLDDVVRFQGGWIRVCERRVLPVPVGALALADRRTGLLLPQVGWGRDGATLGAPVMTRLGPSADLVAMPEWRQERGWRGVGEARLGLAPGEALSASGFGGLDSKRREGRGAAALRGGVTPGPGRLAVDGQWLSDAAVLADYGDGFLARSAPWSESRAVAGVGLLRAETNRYQALGGDDLQARPWSLVAARGGDAVGPLVVHGLLRADGIADAVQRPSDPAERVRLWGAGGAAVGGEVGPTRLLARVDGRVAQWDDAPSALQGRVRGRALLDLWGDVGALRHLAGVGVEGGLARQAGPREIRLPDERPAPAWAVGPALESRWLTASGAPVSMWVTAPVTPTGLRPTARLDLRLGAWQSASQGSRDLQDVRLMRDDGVLRVGAGAIHSGALLQGVAEAAWRLPGPLSELRPGWRAQRDLVGGSWLSQSALLSWESRCDCLDVAASATWSADRAVPDLMLRVEL